MNASQTRLTLSFTHTHIRTGIHLYFFFFFFSRFFFFFERKQKKKWRPTHKSLLSNKHEKSSSVEKKRTFGVSHATGSKVLKDDDEGAQKKKRQEVGRKLADEKELKKKRWQNRARADSLNDVVKQNARREKTLSRHGCRQLSDWFSVLFFCWNRHHRHDHKNNNKKKKSSEKLFTKGRGLDGKKKKPTRKAVCQSAFPSSTWTYIVLFDFLSILFFPFFIYTQKVKKKKREFHYFRASWTDGCHLVGCFVASFCLSFFLFCCLRTKWQPDCGHQRIVIDLTSSLTRVDSLFLSSLWNMWTNSFETRHAHSWLPATAKLIGWRAMKKKL